MKSFKNYITLIIPISILSGTWFDDVPRIIYQPDGLQIECFITGDQYARRLHDSNDFTILHSIEDGFYYYAKKDEQGRLIPSPLMVGRDYPNNAGLEPGYSITEEDYQMKKTLYHQGESLRVQRDAPSSGVISQINVFIRFADDPVFPEQRSYYDRIFQTDNDEPSLSHYYWEISYNNLEVNTYQFPGSFDGSNTSYVDDNVRSYYQPYSSTNPNGYQSQSDRFQREHTLLRDALNSISSSIPSTMDVDLDGNGFVDAVSFVIFGTQGAWADLLWPHRSALFSEEVHINGAQVYDYLFMLSESWYYNVGVLCHEFGHVLGAPDFYQYSPGNGPTPIGYWDLMGKVRSTPQFPSAFTKWKYFNWIDPIEITESGTYSLRPLQEQENAAYTVSSPFSEQEYFIFEYRKQEGIYDSNAPGSRSGLVAYRVNENASNGNASGPPDELYVYRPQGDINSIGNLNDAPYSVVYDHDHLNDFSDPSSFLYNEGEGGFGGLQLYGVTEPLDSISFSVSIGTPELGVNQSSFDFVLESGDFDVQTLVVTNEGEPGTLMDFDLSIADSGSVEWLLISSDTGTLQGVLNGGESVSLHIQAFAAGIGEGNYVSQININSSNIETYSIPINLNVYGENTVPILPPFDISISETGIIDLPNNTDPIFLNVAARYTHVATENGDLIPILIQDDFTIEQVAHVRRVLESYMVDIAGSQWGGNKSMVANAIGATNAILFLLNDENEYENPHIWSLMDAGVMGQDLLSTEVFPEGSDAYMNSTRRDATYEEVLHFVHGFGLQVAVPDMQNAILSAMNIAMESENYFPLSDLPVEDYDEEYLAMGLECYFGLWSHDPSGDGFCGDHEYAFITRQSMFEGDPELFNIIRGFFGPSLEYTASLPANFNGDFYLSYQAGLDYTYRSQYLKNIELSGSENIAIFGNEHANEVFGNAGDNAFQGFSGDDLFVGSYGNDRAIFIGERDNYEVVAPQILGDSLLRVIDIQPARDGSDRLQEVEVLEFNGSVYQLDELLSSRSQGSLPNEFSLYPPFPNPFNPKTKIAFNVIKNGKIGLVIFDISGRLVRTFNISNIGPGYHQLEWDAKDDHGSVVSAGVYFLRFNSEANYQVQKVILLK